MDTVFLAFANSNTDKLHTLSEEDEKVYSVLSRRKSSMGDLDVLREQYATTNRVMENLYMYQDKISIFLYSGHAGRDRLLLEDQEANAEGIAALLQECPNIKLVVLNGCSTKGQVQQLLDNGIPIVIATAAPINDTSATQFSIAFFTSLVERANSIDKAFQDGLAAAKTVSEQPIESHRGIGHRAKGDKEALWGIYYKPENEMFLKWQLGEAPASSEVFEPNKLLLEATWEAIKPHLKITDPDSLSSNDRIDKIITELPHPVSDYLRKLIASPTPGEEDRFYNELGINRLKYLLYTYSICIDLLAVTMLAQLWDEKNKGKKINLSPSLQTELEKLFACNFRDRKTYSLIPLITEIRKFFDAQKIDYFIEEFVELSNTFREESEFAAACTYIETVRTEILVDGDTNEQKAQKLCVDIEKNLAIILRKLGFLAKYKMASMKGIDYIKYKHNTEPRFQHNFVELRYRPSGMNIESETMEESIDNASVVFLHEKANGEFAYLNLSPFIIDINSFDDKAQLADLCLFLSHEPALKALAYRYIYKPMAFPLRIDSKKKYAKIVYDQLDAFYQLIFQKSIIA